MKRDWTDAEFEVVSEEKPRPVPWDPFWGLGPIARLICAVISAAIMGGLYLVVWPIVSRTVDWLFAAAGH